MTPLGTSLDNKVIRPFLGSGINGRNLQKPILVITITDGEPTGEPQNTVANVIKNAKNMCANSMYGPGAIAFEFAQVGKDTKAQAFLGRLDTDPEIGKMIDATSYYELEAEEYGRRGVQLTPELWLVKLMVGAIDPTYDEQVGCPAVLSAVTFAVCWLFVGKLVVAGLILFVWFMPLVVCSHVCRCQTCIIVVVIFA